MRIENLLQFNWFDYTLVAIIGISLFVSILRGLVREALSLATWILAFWAAIHFQSAVAELLIKYITTPSIRSILGFTGILALMLLFGALVSFLVAEFIKATGLSGTDKMLGMLFGALRGILLVAVLILLGEMTSVTRDTWWQKSILVPHFHGPVVWLHKFLPATNNSL